jgi:hypothetical protein
MTLLNISNSLFTPFGADVSGSDPLSHTFTDTLSLTQTVGVSLSVQETVTDNLDLTQTVGIVLTVQHPITDILDFQQTVTLYRSQIMTVSDVIEFEDTLTIAGNFTTVIRHTIPFSESTIDRIYENNIISVPSVLILKEQNYVTLQSPTSAIILPNPLFSDTESNVNDVHLSKTVGGKKYSYIKTTKRKHLKYEFNFRYKKCLELRNFLDSSNDIWLTMTNWKNEVWKVILINNPITFTAIDREMYSVTLEFEGYKIVPGDYRCFN